MRIVTQHKLTRQASFVWARLGLCVCGVMQVVVILLPLLLLQPRVSDGFLLLWHPTTRNNIGESTPFFLPKIEPSPPFLKKGLYSKHDDDDDDDSVLLVRNNPTQVRIRVPSVVKQLKDHVRRNDTGTLITATGYIIAKRQLSKNLVFLDLHTGIRHSNNGNNDNDDKGEADFGNDDDDDNPIFQALLKRDDFVSTKSGDHDGNDDDTCYNYQLYQKCLHKGTHLQITGHASSTHNPGNVVLTIHSMVLLTVPRQVQHIETILRQCYDSMINMGKEKQEQEQTYRVIYQQQVAAACRFDSREELVERLRHVQQSRSNSTELVISKKKNNSDNPSLRDLAKSILQDNLSSQYSNEDPSYPWEWIDDRLLSRERPSSSTRYVMTNAPLSLKLPPTGLLLTRAAAADDDDLTYSGMVGVTENNNKNRTQKPCILRGQVQNRRRYHGDITVLMVEVDKTDGDETTMNEFLNTDMAPERVECVLHPESLARSEDGAVYRNVAAVGATLSLKGMLVSSHQHKDTKVLWVEEVTLVQAASQPSSIATLLDLVQAGEMKVQEGANALGLTSSEMTDIVTNMTKTEQQWKANQLSLSLQRKEKLTSSTLSLQQNQVIQKYRYLLSQYPVTRVTGVRNSDPFFEESHPQTIASKTSRWEARKLPQIAWMCREISAIVREHPEYGKRKISILDIGGGKGHLAHYLSRFLENVEITVVDIGVGAVRNGEKKRMRISNGRTKIPLSMVNFRVADASSSRLEGIQADVVVALHACGHLTDVALCHALDRNASFITVPCCFNSNSHLNLPFPSLLKEGLPVHEWLGISEENWSELKAIAEIQHDASSAFLGMHLISAIRAEAMQRKLGEKQSSDASQFLHIKSFPVEYSTRNLALVGNLCAAHSL